MNSEMLLQLANFLEELPKERFDYKDWVGKDWQGKPDLSCGTTACALGWATVIWPDKMCITSNMYGSIYIEEVGASRSKCSSFLTAMSVFNISQDEAEYLFAPSDNIEELYTAQEVATKIKEFVKTGKVNREWRPDDSTNSA